MTIGRLFARKEKEKCILCNIQHLKSKQCKACTEDMNILLQWLSYYEKWILLSMQVSKCLHAKNEDSGVNWLPQRSEAKPYDSLVENVGRFWLFLKNLLTCFWYCFVMANNLLILDSSTKMGYFNDYLKILILFWYFLGSGFCKIEHSSFENKKTVNEFPERFH